MENKKDNIEEIKKGRGRPKKENLDKNIYIKKFIANNKEKIKEKVECPVCGGRYDYFNKSRHCKSAKHLKQKKILEDLEKIIDEKDKIIYKLKNKIK